MNWEFLVGLLVPAFGLIFAWMVKQAREEPTVYRLIEPAMQVSSALLAAGSAWAFCDLRTWEGLTGTAKISAMASFAALAIFFLAVLGSTFIFKSISKLPPRHDAAPKPTDIATNSRTRPER